MAKQEIQRVNVVWETSTGLSANASATSGSFVSEGYGRLCGMFISSGSLKAGSGIVIRQSPDYVPHWDYSTDDTAAACDGAGFSVEVVGKAMQIEIRNGSEAAGTLRSYWFLRPI
jgi:hypothetical protein